MKLYFENLSPHDKIYYQNIESFIDSIGRYIEHRFPPGDFGMAVLENKFVDAVGRADSFNQRNLVLISQYVYNMIPANSWGSPEIVRRWLNPVTRDERMKNVSDNDGE